MVSDNVPNPAIVNANDDSSAYDSKIWKEKIAYIYYIMLDAFGAIR